MRASGFFLFLSTVLFVYFLINFYIFKQGWPATSLMGGYRYVALALFLFFTLAYPTGRFAGRLFRGGLTEFLVYVGSFYLAIMVYMALLILLIDLLRMGNHFLHYFPPAITDEPERAAGVAFLVVVITASALVGAGHLNALHPRVRTLSVTIQKPANTLKSLNIVMASDIHLGRNIRIPGLLKIVETINHLKPDLVFLPGDIMDEDISALPENDFAAPLQRIIAGYGVFAVTGNHEYYGGVKAAIASVRRGNVTVLEDTAVKIADAFYIIGRKDRTAANFGERRKSLQGIMKGIDPTYPLFLMDHQPFHLEEAQQNGIDLQLSGHTHNGQLIPFNLITKRVYEMSWGYLAKGNTQYYVSCGLGTWGPPVRLGNVPEIVQVKVTFK